MKISFDWLSDFIDITENDPQKIKDIITERSAEVETMESQGEALEKIVVGEITEVKDHPDADALRICMVNDGQDMVKIVCGGSNLEVGQHVVLAKLGAVVRWHGDEVVTMKKAKIRGEESFGMICAAEEVGLADRFPKAKDKEIVDLTPLGLTVGMPLAEALKLDDVALDIDNHAITNRSDLFSHRGFAREFVANKLGTWRSTYLRPTASGDKKEFEAFEMPEVNAAAPIEIEFENKELCSRYVGVYLTDVSVQESPEWMKKRLTACGVNPISNLVDITNYVMLELGMPLHAFDVDRVKGKKWVMRPSKKGEKLVTLDGKEHELGGGYIVLDDGHELIDLCGVMGGASSGIESGTKNVWLIAPVYHPSLVRKGMRGLGHVTDAGVIYEKGVDPYLASNGLARAVELIQELCPSAKVTSQVMDVWNIKQEEKVLDLDLNQVNRLIGVEIEPKTVEELLNHLDFWFEPTDSKLQADSSKLTYKVNIPSHRHNDIHREADLIEEIARIYGFNNIPEILPTEPIKPVFPLKHRILEREMKEKLVGFGYNEIYTYAFLGPELLEKTGLKVTEEMIELTNPISSDMSLMRTSLLPRMMETIAGNLRYKNEFGLFELSKVYQRKTNTEHVERSKLLIAKVGEAFRGMQGVAEALGMIILPPRNKEKNPMHHPGRVSELMVRGKVVGHLFEVHPQILKNFDLKERVTVCEIDVSLLSEMGIETRPKYKEINRFPAIQLDVSVLVNQKELAGDYLSTIEKTDKKLITTVELIDEYAGEKIPEGKRALTYSITYQASDRTLTDQEVETVHKQVLERLEKKGGEVRI